MFGRWLRRKNPSGPPIALPNLDEEVTAHWNRGAAPPTLPANAPADSLDFEPAPAYRAGKTKEHRRRRRRLLLSLLVAPLMVVAFFYFYPWINSLLHGTHSLGQRMTFGPENQEEIFYTNDIESEQALRLGTCLQSEGVFDGRSPKSVQLSKDGDVFVVGFVLEWGMWSDRDTIAGFHDLLPRLSRGAFEGRPVEIHLCAPQADSKGKLMPTMRVVRADVER